MAGGTGMRRMMIALFLTLALTACEKTDFTSRKKVSGGGGRPAPEVVEDSSVVLKPEFYSVCIEYPAGYDWRSDPDYGTVRCNMVVRKGNVEVRTVPAGHQYETASDSDMMTLQGDTLYTSYYSSGHTVFKKNGEEVLRFPSNEATVSIMVSNDVFHSVGTPRDGSGWIYRENGQLRVQSDEGEPFAPLYIDNGKVIFHTMYIKSGPGARPVYGIVSDGLFRNIKEYSDAVPGAIRVNAGKTFAVYYGDDSSYMIMNVNESHVLLNMSGRHGIKPKDILFDETGIPHVLGMGTDSNGVSNYILWKKQLVMHCFPDHLAVDFCFVHNDKVFAVCHPKGNEGEVIIYEDGKETKIPGLFMPVERNCIAFFRGHYLLCLSPQSTSDSPVMVEDGKVMRLGVNGCFSAASMIILPK